MMISIGKSEKKDGYEDYELDEACRTLLEAEKIKSDTKLMEAVKPLLAKKAEAYKKLSELDVLREKSKKMSEEESEY